MFKKVKKRDNKSQLIQKEFRSLSLKILFSYKLVQDFWKFSHTTNSSTASSRLCILIV